MPAKPIDLSSLRKALVQIEEAFLFWCSQLPDNPLTKHLCAAAVQAEVFVFGSRAAHRARPFSVRDLLFAKPERLSLEQGADLRDAFEVCDSPFCVDIVDSASLQPLVAKRVQEERMALV